MARNLQPRIHLSRRFKATRTHDFYHVRCTSQNEITLIKLDGRDTRCVSLEAKGCPTSFRNSRTKRQSTVSHEIIMVSMTDTHAATFRSMLHIESIISFYSERRCPFVFSLPVSFIGWLYDVIARTTRLSWRIPV